MEELAPRPNVVFSLAVGQYAFKNDMLLLAFQSKWDVLILPLLSTHMGLTFLSKGIETVSDQMD